MKNSAFAIWITGLPGSGKSVISEKLKQILDEKGICAQILRMDDMRKIVTPTPKYTDEERQLVYNAFTYTAKILTDNGINVIMDATGNLRKYRELAKKIIKNFMEVYLKCPLKVAIERESQRKDTRSAPKNIYKKGLSGESSTVPGLQSSYEPPVSPALVLESDKLSVDECANRIYLKIKEVLLNKSG
ncbi:MAG: adenylyl-sulfate kinase [Candidatus Odinarchaeia archaeon]